MSAKNTSCVRARAKARACPHVCGSSSGLLKACWEACHCKSGKGKSPKCTEERTHHPPFYIYLSPFLFYSLTLSFFFSYWLVHSTSLLQYYISFMNALCWSKWRIKCETHPDSSPGSFTKQVSTFIVSVCSFVSMIELYLLGSLSARMSSFHTKIKWHVISG